MPEWELAPFREVETHAGAVVKADQMAASIAFDYLHSCSVARENSSYFQLQTETQYE